MPSRFSALNLAEKNVTAALEDMGLVLSQKNIASIFDNLDKLNAHFEILDADVLDKSGASR